MSPALAGQYVCTDGRAGIGYVLRHDHLGGIGGQVAQLGNNCQAFGGSAVSGNIVYLPCTTGPRAVTIAADGTTTELWRAAPSVPAEDSPVIGGGAVWVVDTPWRCPLRPQPRHRCGAGQHPSRTGSELHLAYPVREPRLRRHHHRRYRRQRRLTKTCARLSSVRGGLQRRLGRGCCLSRGAPFFVILTTFIEVGHPLLAVDRHDGRVQAGGENRPRDVRGERSAGQPVCGGRAA